MKSKAAANRKLVILGIVHLVFLAACGGGTGQPSQPGGGSNPNPSITKISPTSAVAGSAAFTLTINGANFVAGSLVNFGGSSPATTFVSSTVLTADIPAVSIASTGTPGVTVTNPVPGGGTSNTISFSITSSFTNSVPTINSLYPSCAPAGSLESFVGGLSVGGTNFVASSVVRWNGTDQPTTLYPDSGGTILTAQISASDIAAAGTAAVTVFNPGPGGGTSNSSTFTINPGAIDPLAIAVDPAGMFAYVASAGCAGGTGGYVSMYTINSTTGALASIAPAVPTNDVGTGSVAVDPAANFVYVTNEGQYYSDGSISAYSINPTTGALTSTTGGITGNSPDFCCFNWVAVDPSGKFAYAANGGTTQGVSMFTINATTGALTSTGAIAAEDFPVSVTVDPSGKFAYVAQESQTISPEAGSVSMYKINATTGALASIGTIAAGINPVSVAVDPAGKFAYVANFASNDVSTYTINATTGALTSIGTIAAGTGPVSVAVDPAGNFAYVTNVNSNDVSMFTINAASGALTPMGSIPAGSSPTSIAIPPSGKFAYVTNSGSNDVSMYSIDAAAGVLTLIGTIGS